MKLVIPVNEHDHAIGPTDARVTVVMYGDYECPDCQRTHRANEKVFDELVNKLRFVYRHFPLISVHPRALRAAEAAEAAGAQGYFWEMHRRLYTHPGKLSDKDLHHHAREVGLDLNRFDEEMARSIYAGQILKEYHNSIIYGITGTPTIFVNSELYTLSVPLLETVRNLLST